MRGALATYHSFYIRSYILDSALDFIENERHF